MYSTLCLMIAVSQCQPVGVPGKPKKADCVEDVEFMISAHSLSDRAQGPLEAFGKKCRLSRTRNIIMRHLRCVCDVLSKENVHSHRTGWGVARLPGNFVSALLQ